VRLSLDEEHGPPRPRPAMPERDYHLAQADWHIAETKQLMARQRDFVTMLETTNQPSEPALSMLEALENSLKASIIDGRSYSYIPGCAKALKGRGARPP
jgi:hypothetical protein